MQTMNFRKMVLKMRQAQKLYFKQPCRAAQDVAMSWERRVDEWLEKNAQDEIKLEAFTSGRAMVELPGVYNVTDEAEEEKEPGA
jgi:hypothetical protein